MRLPAAGAGSLDRWIGPGVAAAVALAATLLPYHRGLHFPFSLDDYTYLFQAAGIDPVQAPLRRWLSVHGWYELMFSLFGPRPLPWHVAAFLLHAGNALWVYTLGRRLGATPPAAWIGAGLFAASPIDFTVLYWIACVQELLACFFVLAAVWVALRDDRHRWAAVPLFGLAMLAKESVLAAPLVLFVLRGRRVWPLAGAMLLVGAALFAGAGLHQRLLDSGPESPYATAYGTNLAVHLATLLVWFLAPWRAYPDRLAAPDPALVVPAAAAVMVVSMVLLVWRQTGMRPVLRASVWFVALLLPVLPLRQHSYAYYDYVPQIGFLLLLGAAVEGAARRFQRHASEWRLALGAAAVSVCILFAARNARVHETLMLPNSLIPHDSVVRYGAAAGAIVAALHAAQLAPEVKRIAFVFPPPELSRRTSTPGKAEPGMKRIRKFPLRESYRDGKLLALHFPHLESAWTDSLGRRDEAADTAIFWTSGFNDVVRIENAARAHALLAQAKYYAQDAAGARRELEHAVRLAPGDAEARVLLAGVVLQAGDLGRAVSLLAPVQADSLPAELRPFFASVRHVADSLLSTLVGRGGGK
jgi:hypothetical protein